MSFKCAYKCMCIPRCDALSRKYSIRAESRSLGPLLVMNEGLRFSITQAGCQLGDNNLFLQSTPQIVQARHRSRINILALLVSFPVIFLATLESVVISIIGQEGTETQNTFAQYATSRHELQKSLPSLGQFHFLAKSRLAHGSLSSGITSSIESKVGWKD